ncbi:MAG TPA: hypothetical protein DDZ80_06645 [Cyanobacteria bacterium UBA8803]|nr:hypothetical protein [Cyanobacteria bacterium UBA9273]HBL58202.1 hypothetical protein [Cyanobacteria bacterium UBA8803]
MKFKLVAISTIVLTLPFSIWLTKSVLSSPDIEVVSTYNLGTVSKGQIAVANLPVQNLGNAPLKVEAVSTSCGCTTAKLSPMTIPSGGKAILHVEYNSNAHEADRGAIERYVFISSNAPSERDLQIKFSVFVQENAASKPSPKVASR